MTLRLGVLAFVLSSIVGISLGILSAVKQYSSADVFGTTVSILLSSIPGFFLGMVLIYLFGLKLGVLPTHGIDEWRSYILPVITLAAGGSAQLMRLTRTTMLEAIRQDYMRTARAKGCTPARMIWKHALKNAILPVLTVMGTSFGSILGGAVICETVFSMQDSIGLLAEGYLADIIAVEGNPAQEIGALGRIAAVWQEGTKVYESESAHLCQ